MARRKSSRNKSRVSAGPVARYSAKPRGVAGRVRLDSTPLTKPVPTGGGIVSGSNRQSMTLPAKAKHRVVLPVVEARPPRPKPVRKVMKRKVSLPAASLSAKQVRAASVRPSVVRPPVVNPPKRSSVAKTPFIKKAATLAASNPSVVRPNLHEKPKAVHSDTRKLERPRCKPRPVGDETRRRSGVGSSRGFVPWCS